MATVSASDINKALYSGDRGNCGIFYGTVTATPATGDVWRLCKLPAGFKVVQVILANADLGTAAPADIGYEHIDGTTGDADAFGAAQALGTAATATIDYLHDAPVTLAKDSFLTLTFGTVDTGASGKVSVTVLGEIFGAP